MSRICPHPTASGRKVRPGQSRGSRRGWRVAGAAGRDSRQRRDRDTQAWGVSPSAQAAPERRRETHQQQTDERAQTVPQRPLVLILEHLWLQQLQDPQHVQEEGQVVLLAELLEVEVGAAVKERCDHGQVPGDNKDHSMVRSPRNPAPRPDPTGNPHSGTQEADRHTPASPHGLGLADVSTWPPRTSRPVPGLTNPPGLSLGPALPQSGGSPRP